MSRAAAVPGHPPPTDVPLVGRAAELDLLRGALTRVASGGGRAVLVTGHPGVGKTALLNAALADARAAGFVTLAGRGHEAERGLAYAPIVDAFGPDLGRLGVRRASALVQGLPQLGRLFTGVPGRPEVLGDQAMERLRLVDAVARLCERVTASTPLLMVMDDLHWADGATLQLVHHLLRRLQGDRFLLLATARTSAADDPTAPEYGAFRFSALRSGLVDELPLEPLGRGEVAALLAHLLPGATPGQGVVDEAFQRSGGVPLFVGALARSFVETDALVVVDGAWTPARASGLPEPARTVPPVLRTVLDDQLARLDPADRRVLDLLAVHAAPLRHAVLLAAAGCDEPSLLGALSRLRGAGVVREHDEGGAVTYTVSHALLAEAATDGLAAVARQRLHLALADAAETASARSVEAVARHLLGAGDLCADTRIVPTLLAAAESAGRRGDHGSAANHLGEVVTRLRAGRGSGPPGSVLERWADALYRTGRAADAVEVWEECLNAGDGRSAAALHRLLAAAERDRGNIDAAAAHLNDAVAAAELATGRSADPVAAEFLAGLLADRFALAERCQDQVVAQQAADDLAELAGRSGSAPVVVEAALTRAGLHRACGNIDLAGVAAADALSAARRAGSPPLELRALVAVLEVAIEASSPSVLRAHADQALVLAGRLGAPAFELRAIGSRAAAGVMDGDWRAADRDLAHTIALSRRFDVPRSLATALGLRGVLQVFRGDLAAAETTIGEAGRYADLVPRDRHVNGDLAMARCWLAVARADRGRVAELVPDLMGGGGRNVAWRLLTAATALVFLGRPGEVAAVAETLAIAAAGPFRSALADWVAGLAGWGTPAEHLRSAVDSLAAQGLPYWSALARLDLADRTPEPAVALELAGEALDVLEPMGARRAADRARRLLRGLGARPRPPRRAGPAGGPLSARELEVARLFTEGLTTAEVAGRLVISPHTVTAHLRRIYSRLGVHSRAALTRILAEKDLLGAD